MNIGDIVRHVPSGDLVSSVLQSEPEFEAGIIIKKQDVISTSNWNPAHYLVMSSSRSLAWYAREELESIND
jgi:hypothetical protein